MLVYTCSIRTINTAEENCICMTKCRAGFDTDVIAMDITKQIYTFNPEYKSRNYDENDFHLIIKHNQNHFGEYYFVISAKLCNSLPPSYKNI